MEKKINKIVDRTARECKYDPIRDIQEVESGLAVDITDALNTGVVRDTTYEDGSNGITEPDAIVGRISDVFDAIEASRVVHKYGTKARAASIVSKEGAAAAPASAGGASAPAASASE